MLCRLMQKMNIIDKADIAISLSQRINPDHIMQQWKLLQKNMTKTLSNQFDSLNWFMFVFWWKSCLWKDKPEQWYFRRECVALI